MKTYAHVAGLVLALLLASCSKPAQTDTTDNADPNESGKVEIFMVLENSNTYTAENWEGTADGDWVPVMASPEFSGSMNPFMTSFHSESIVFFETINACERKMVLYDISKDEETELPMFTDLVHCNWELNAMTHTETAVFLAYTLSLEGKERSHFVRRMALDAQNPEWVDLPLDKMPIDLEAVDKKLFVLDFDADITNENGLVIIDLDQNDITQEINLGYNVGNMFQDTNGHIVIAYPELHTVFNSSTLAVSHSRYGEGTEPNFFNSPLTVFDPVGHMHFLRQTPSGATDRIAATYDFKNNRTTLYYFENFLTPHQLGTELQIKRATSVAYDRDANVLYIGYQKIAPLDKGGVLRLRLDTTTGYLGNTNVDGVPVALYLQ